jgi:hypothetical protein
MNPFVAYAKVPMSFLNLYLPGRESTGRYLVAIACAMTGILVINIWSALLVIVIVTRTSLVGSHYIEAGTYALFLALVFVLELAFVYFVQRRVLNDPGFARQVAATSPKVSNWYVGISVGLLCSVDRSYESRLII